MNYRKNLPSWNATTKKIWKPTPWKINMEPTNHPFRKENDLPNLHDYVPWLIFKGVSPKLPPWTHLAPVAQVLCAVFSGDGAMIRCLATARADVNGRLHGLGPLGAWTWIDLDRFGGSMSTANGGNLKFICGSRNCLPLRDGRGKEKLGLGQKTVAKW